MLPSKSNHLAKTLKLFSVEEDCTKTIGSQEDFQKRIKSYIGEQKWIKKLLSLSPPACARYGWKCVSINMLQCVTCSATLCASLPTLGKFSSYKKCEQKILRDLKYAHKKHCPWPVAPCPDSFIRMTAVHKEVAFQEFISRLESLLQIEVHLPKIKTGIMEKLGISEDCFTSLCKLSHVTESDAGRSAVILAATGWSRVCHAERKKYIMCCHCQRNVGLWFYTPANHESQKESSVDNDLNNQSDAQLSPLKDEVEHCILDSENAVCAKKQKIDMNCIESFDPLYEHRPWCLWVIDSDCQQLGDVNETELQTGSKETVLPGWKIYIHCLLKNLNTCDLAPSKFRSPSKEQLSKARKMLESWTEPVLIN